jgi:glycine/serine hydroxymethyltransferase
MVLSVMTKKHFKEVADLISKELKFAETPSAKTAIREVAKGLCETFKSLNSNFNKEKFLDACGI